MIEVEWWEFEDRDTLAKEVAGDVGFIIEQAIETNGKAELALPGDAIFEPIYDIIAARDFDWSKVRIIPTNERIVEAGSGNSVYELLQDKFGSVGAKIEPLIDLEKNWSTKEAGQSADARLAGFSWPIDLVWLGVRDDGSTASIFPEKMEDALNTPRGRRAVGVSLSQAPAEGHQERVTLTREALLSAHTLLITLAGEQAKSVLQKAIDDGPGSTVPIGRVIANAEVPIDIYWSAS